MKALIFASVASMVDLFNRDNIQILDDLGYEVSIACNFKEGSVYSKGQAYEFRKELMSNGYDVVDVPVPRSMFDVSGMLQTIRILSRDIKRKNYDIIHCQSPIGGVLCRIVANSSRRFGTKVLYYAHGFHFYKGADMLNWALFYPIERICAHFTDCLLTLNKEDYLRASNQFKTRVEYIPGIGIDLNKINDVQGNREKTCKELCIPSECKIVISVCELSARKNCEVAIRAFSQMKDQESILVLCGIGEQMEYLKDLALELDIRKRVYFVGFQKDIIEVLKIADLFIFTSKQEGLPVALMQAMACKLPVICSRIRGNVDLITHKEGGYMFHPENVEGFAKGLDHLLHCEKLCKKMGNINAERVQNYGKIAVNEIMENIYLSLGGNDE